MRLRGLSPASIYQRERALIRLEAALRKPLLEATEADLRAWQEGLRGSLAYHANQVANCAQFFAWAHETADLIPENPARRLVRPKVGRGLPRPLADDHLEVAIRTAAPDVRCWLVLGAYAGLRCGEMSRLERRDLLDTVPEPVMLLRGKGGKQRIVPVSARVLFELRAYGLPSRGPIFRRRDGRQGAPTPARISQLVNDHLHGLGITDTGHSTRHHFATHIYRISRDLRLVQELLGHSDPATTAVYAAYAQSEASEVVGQLSNPRASSHAASSRVATLCGDAPPDRDSRDSRHARGEQAAGVSDHLAARLPAARRAPGDSGMGRGAGDGLDR